MRRNREITISNPPKRNPDKAERKRIRLAEQFATRVDDGFKLITASQRN